jgi:ribosomal protein S18 acetylase RimI-like enzyme
LGGGKQLSDYVRQNLAAELKKRPAHVFLAFDGETPAGLATCIEGFSTFACKPLLNLHDLAVMPLISRPGRGPAAAGNSRGKARKLGCCKLTLEVLEGNAVARSLYRSCGFGATNSRRRPARRCSCTSRWLELPDRAQKNARIIDAGIFVLGLILHCPSAPAFSRP